MSLWLCSSSVCPSTRYELCFPWILSNSNRKLCTISLAVKHAHTLPKLVVAQRKHVVVEEPAVEIRISAENLGSLREAVQALESFAERGRKVSANSYTKLLQSCADLNCIELGRRIHAWLSAVENPDPFVETKLVSMYSKCGCLSDARKMFDGIPERNLFTFSAMIGAYSRAQKWDRVFDLFVMMVRDGFIPNRFLFPKIIEACGNARDSEATEVIHSMVIKLGFCDSIRVCTSILAVYANSGKLDCAMKLFNQMENRNAVSWTAIITGFLQEGLIEEAMGFMEKMKDFGIAPNVVTWTAMISGLSRHDRRSQAMEMFKAMLFEGVEPNAVTITSVISACANSLVKGKVIHAFSVKIGLFENVRVGSSLVDMYCKCGDLEAAQQVFDSMVERNAFTWNSLIGGYCRAGHTGKAWELVVKMRESGVEPNVFTWNVIITGFFQKGLIEEAFEVTKKMESLGIAPDVVTWTSMISGLSNNDRRDQSLDMFKRMLSEGVEPSAITITSVVSACSSLLKGKEIHAFSIKIGFIDDVRVGSSLVDVYCKCGDLEAAQQVFDAMIERNIYTWNSLIGGYCQAGYSSEAGKLVEKMKESGVEPDEFTWDVMISGYMRNGHEELAVDLFQRMEKDGKIKRGTASWTTLVAGYLQLGEKDKAFSMFRQMQLDSVVPNMATVLTVLPACGNLLAAKNVREMHCCILRRSLESELPVANSLVDTYAKSGNLRYSKTLFEGMGRKDIITWNSMISVYVSHGFPDLAIRMYDQVMESRLKPTGGTFLPLIYAYGLSGRVEDGKKAFSRMLEDHHIVPGPEHYSAMVHLLGRAGRLEEAVELIADMPMEPNFAVWSALLTASRIHRNVGLASRALDKMLELEPRNHLVQRLRTQINGFAGKSKPERENARELGRSWIELDNTVYTFHAGDQSHPYLFPWITRKGKSQCGFHDGHCIEEEDKEEVAGIHSEKLALWFALFTFPEKTQCIRIVKNLRMCGNCHETVKCVSKLYGREIFINDSKRLHRFSDGECSCRDYW